MISIAGVIGAGLFIGSATAIKIAGSAVLIAYAMAGLLVVLVMRMLGEMATAHPVTGSFSTYAGWSRTTRRGVPAQAIIASTGVGFLGVVGNYLLPGEVFGYMLATSGAIALFVYLVIAVTQLRMRRELDAAGMRPAVRMWAYPGLTYLTIGFICTVLVMMAIRPGLRLELWLSLALAAVVVAIGVARHRDGSPAQTGYRWSSRPGADLAQPVSMPAGPA